MTDSSEEKQIRLSHISATLDELRTHLCTIVYRGEVYANALPSARAALEWVELMSDVASCDELLDGDYTLPDIQPDLDRRLSQTSCFDAKASGVNAKRLWLPSIPDTAGPAGTALFSSVNSAWPESNAGTTPAPIRRFQHDYLALEEKARTEDRLRAALHSLDPSLACEFDQVRDVVDRIGLPGQPHSSSEIQMRNVIEHTKGKLWKKVKQITGQTKRNKQWDAICRHYARAEVERDRAFRAAEQLMSGARGSTLHGRLSVDLKNFEGGSASHVNQSYIEMVDLLLTLLLALGFGREWTNGWTVET